MLYDFKKKKWRSTKAKGLDNPNWSWDGKYIYFDTSGSDRALRPYQGSGWARGS
jgi:hypothetical protein